MIFCNKVFYFSYNILNAPSEKIMILWNFCHLFQCCFMRETQVLMTVSRFFGFFSRNRFMEGNFTFKGWGGWGFIFKWGRGVALWGGISFDGGRVSKKSCDGGGGTPPMPPPHYRKPCDGTIGENPSTILQFKSKAIYIELILKDFIHFIY